MDADSGVVCDSLQIASAECFLESQHEGLKQVGFPRGLPTEFPVGPFAGADVGAGRGTEMFVAPQPGAESPFESGYGGKTAPRLAGCELEDRPPGQVGVPGHAPHARLVERLLQSPRQRLREERYGGGSVFEGAVRPRTFFCQIAGWAAL